MAVPSLRPIKLDLSPAEAAAALAREPGLVFLDSSLETPDALSILGTHPESLCEGTDWDGLQKTLAAHAVETEDHGLPQGAAIGWIGYDGLFRFGIYPHLLIYRHATAEWLAVGNPRLPDAERSVPTALSRPEFVPGIDREEYCKIVRRTRACIASGDIYQACLAHRFVADWPEHPWPLYSALRHYSPAPYSAYLALGDTAVLSASPECFLEMTGRSILTRPIKGTRPRRSDADQDERSAYDLRTSPKEIAELVMITDLERNDLGRVCEYGSVHASDMLRLERYEQVFHLVSTVEGTLRADISHLDALRACFPGGSISGAPKKRAMEIIAELEPVPRGIYTGAIGFFGFNGESRFNIAIRTIVQQAGVLSFHVGAGIVADSTPDQEWQETLDKAAGILLAASRMEVSSSPRPARSSAR